MKIALILLVPLLFCFSASVGSTAQKAKAPGVYRHIVLFKFKDTATKEQITGIEKKFATLRKKINTIIDYEWGTNVSPENHAQNLTHCFIVSFKDKTGFKAYLPHPEHKAFIKELLPILDKVVVVDFVAQKN